MKKKIAVIALFALIAVMALSLVACGPTGTYKFHSMKIDMGGASMEIEAGKEVDVMGTKMTIDKDAITFELKSDKTFVLKGSMMGENVEENGTWEQKDGKILLTVDSETIEATLKGGVLTFEMEEGMTISFKK